jgi:methyl-accepting chemotaxis protein
MMKFLGRLKLSQKLALLVAVLLLPMAVVGTLYVQEANGDVQRLESELAGSDYLRALGDVADDLSLHRGRVNVMLSGDSSRRAAVLQAQAQLEQHAAGVDKLDAQYGAEFESTAHWQAVKSDWAQLKVRLDTMEPREALLAQRALMAKIVGLRGEVAMNSGLALDSDPATNGLIQIATYDMSALTEQFDRARNLSVSAAPRGSVPEGDEAIARSNGEEARVTLDSMEKSLATVAATRPASAQPLAPLLATTKAATATYLQFLETNVWQPERFSLDATRIYDAGGALSDSLTPLLGGAYDQLVEALDQRVSAVTNARNFLLALVLAAMAVALVLSWLVTRSLTRPMSHAIEVFGAIAQGKYDSVVTVSGTDEVGQVLTALDDTQSKLRAQIEAERKQSAENARIRQALDKVSTSVVLADAGNEIIYVNEAAEQTFTRNEGEMRRQLPGLSARNLRGSNLDALMRDDSLRRRVAGLSGSEVDEGRYGACTFKVVLNPVKDESGTRLGTVLEWTDRTQEVAVEEEVGKIVAEAVEGDLRGRIRTEGKTGFFEKLAVGMNGLLENMSGIVSMIKGAAREVQTGAEEISQGNANLSQRTEEQASSLEETASSIEEMTSTVKQNADNAGQANQLAVAARDQADRGGAVVASAVRAMSEINESSKKIADIIGVIDEIAFQTNLLALNAAVEAARAGEQGRGFAVVASEVRSLAQRSATAAKEIKDLIQDSVKKVDEGSTLVTQSGQTLEHIVSSVKKVSDIVAEIAAASQEQSAGIEQVNKAVMQLDELTQQNAALVEEAAAASESMADQARGLGTTIGRYQVLGGTAAVSAAAPAPAKVAAAAAPPAERRGANRPWSGGGAKVGAAAAKPAAKAPAAKPAAKAASSDAEWAEF